LKTQTTSIRFVKLLSVVAFILVSITVVSAQTINQRYHFEQQNLVMCGVITTDSCIYTSGIYLPANGAPSYIGSFLAKLALDGTLEWFKPIIDSITSIELWFDALIPTIEGGFANVGYQVDYANGYHNAYFIKYDQLGDSLFTTKISPWDTAMNGWHQQVALVQTADSGFVFAGSIQFNDFNFQAVVLKLDKNGNHLWTKEYGDAWDNRVKNLTLAQDGGFYIGAWKTNAGFNGGIQQIWYSNIIKTDSAGNIEWEYLSDETLVEGVHDLIETPDGGLIYGSGWGTENGHSAVFKGYVVKLDDQMQVEWDLILDGTSRNEGGELHVAALPDGNYAVSDMTHTQDTTETMLGLGYTYFGRLTKINPQGQIIWQRWYFPDDLTGDHFKDMYDMQATDDGFTMVAHSIDYEATSQGQRGWLIKTDTSGCLTPGCGSVGIIDPEAMEIGQMLIYPNPATNHIAIDLSLPAGTKGGTLEIVDMLGRTVYSEAIPFHNTSYDVNTSAWANGRYNAVVVSEDAQFSQALIIVK
jgi:hypothetical protein